LRSHFFFLSLPPNVRLIFYLFILPESL
jgi:hypothetical protein